MKRRIRKTFLVLLVCATAVSTLLATTPHAVCKCPDGQIKQFCVSIFTNQSSCCCSGQCCPKSPKEGASCCCKKSSTNPQKSCCCSHQDKQQPLEKKSTPKKSASKKPSHIPAVRRPSCEKSLADQQIFPAPQQKYAKVSKSMDAGNLFVADHAPASLLLPVDVQRGMRQVYPLPPPVDLVISLQHFLC